MTRKTSNDKKVKLSAALALVLSCILLLAGCGGGTAQSTQESGSKEETAETKTQAVNEENTADTVDTSAMA